MHSIPTRRRKEEPIPAQSLLIYFQRMVHAEVNIECDYSHNSDTHIYTHTFLCLLLTITCQKQELHRAKLLLETATELKQGHHIHQYMQKRHVHKGVGQHPAEFIARRQHIHHCQGVIVNISSADNPIQQIDCAIDAKQELGYDRNSREVVLQAGGLLRLA